VGHHRHFLTFIDSDYIITPTYPPSLELFNIEIGQGLSKEFNFLHFLFGIATNKMLKMLKKEKGRVERALFLM
jgi:hypothetical protein